MASHISHISYTSRTLCTSQALYVRRRSNIRLLLPSLALLLASTGLMVVPVRGAVPAQPPTFQARPANPYGTNVFLHKEVEEWKIEKTLQMVAQANIPWIKQEFPWQEIEFRKNYFHDDKWNKSSWEKFDRIVDLAEKYNLQIVARVSHPPDWAKADPSSGRPLKDYKDLADFINVLLDHYEGRIRYVQVWNEPNLAAEWVPGRPVDPAGYAQLLKEVYPAVKARHPDAVILSAPMAMTLEGPQARGNMNELDYWTGLYEAGVKGNFDVASANGYGLDQPPEAPPDRRVLNFRRVELLHDIMVRNGDGDRPIWFNEYGWNASPESLPEEEKNYWRHVTPRQQAEWTVQGIEYARAHWPWAGVIFIWYFRQVGDIPPDRAEYYFAMVNPDFSTNPVYEAVKQAAAQYPGPASKGVPTPAIQPTNTPVTTVQPSPTPTPPAPGSATPTPPSSTTTATPTTVTATPTAQQGTPQTPQPTSTPSVPAVEGRAGPNLALYILGGALVVAGLAGLGYYFMRSRAAGT